MAAKAYWSDHANIWVIEYVGRLTLGDSEWVTASSQHIAHHANIAVLVDFTEMMYDTPTVDEVQRRRELGDFLSSPNILKIAFVIPDSSANLLHEHVYTRQVDTGRIQKVKFCRSRHEAEVYLTNFLEACCATARTPHD